MSLDNLDAFEKAIAGGGALGVLAVAGMKAISFFRSERAGQQSSDAVATQFKALNESIKSMSTEMEILRTEFGRMDRKVHVQQRTITRLEMVVRRLADLIEQHEITIPGQLRDEIDELLHDEGMNRRATDKPEVNRGAL